MTKRGTTFTRRPVRKKRLAAPLKKRQRISSVDKSGGLTMCREGKSTRKKTLYEQRGKGEGREGTWSDSGPIQQFWERKKPRNWFKPITWGKILPFLSWNNRCNYQRTGKPRKRGGGGQLLYRCREGGRPDGEQKETCLLPQGEVMPTSFFGTRE